MNKPTRLRLIQGTDRPNRRAKKRAPAEPMPEPLVAAHKPPSHLSADGRKAFRRLAPLLTGMSVLSAADLPAFEALCEVMGEVARLRLAISALGGTTYRTTGRDGVSMSRPHPEIAQLGDADRAATALAWGVWSYAGSTRKGDGAACEGG